MAARIAARARILVALAVVAVVAAACTPGKTSSAPATTSSEAGTGIDDVGPVTLTVWDQETGKVGKVWDQLNAEFQAEHPNVTIDRVTKSFGDLKTSLKLALAGPNPPDVVEANQGLPDMGQMVKAGLLRPLDSYADLYGWNDRVSATVNAFNRFTADGKQFGTGNLYGFTDKGEVVGVFYNRPMLEQLGLQVPTTMAEFENALAVAKQAGEVPIAFGNLDKFGGIHEFAAIQDRIAPTTYLTDFIFGLKFDDLSFDIPENLQAAQTLQDWASKGYFTDGFNGAGYDDTVAKFVKGEGLFNITGNWIVANIGQDSTDFGFFLMPPVNAGDPPVTTGGPGFPLSITSGAEQPDVAAAYIEWMTNPHSDELLVPTGQIPLSSESDTSAVPADTVLGQVLAVAKSANASNGLVPYEDWATPTMYDTLTAAVQELMGMKITPQEFVGAVQTDYHEFQISRT